jgi:hypothetical protein
VLEVVEIRFDVSSSKAQRDFENTLAGCQCERAQVTLSQVPYTGLDLGPVGAVLYWGFLGVWAVFAIYLVAIKRVQNKLARWFAFGLFGNH